MKNKIILISVIFVILILGIVVSFNNDVKENNIISNIEKDKQVINSNMITMMYETESGSGEYIETKDNTWPESGYIFNDALSGCENGGELEYNSQNNTVNLLSNSSDQCYVYFDKYDGVWIDNVVPTNVIGSSITLDVSATSENGNITTYYYSLNDSEKFQESSSNIVTINDLNKLTEYNIKIYATDNTGARSNIYELNVSTTDESGPIINSVEVSNVSYNGFTISVESQDNNISRYYFSIDGGTNFVSSINNYYVFTGLERGTLYDIVVYALNANKYESNELNTNATTDSYPALAQYIINEIYTGEDGENNLFYHDKSGNYETAYLEAGDNSYRYTGADPNNYVCFGSDANTCPTDNLYRIIGVFDGQAKLIKVTSYGEYAWDDASSYWNGDNTWSTSILRNVLNSTFLNTFNSTWQKLIATHNWQVGGMENHNNYTVNQYFDYEIGNNSDSTFDSIKIGLMYVSDYGYAASKDFWTLFLNSDFQDDYNIAINDNWLYLGQDEWTMSRTTSSKNNSFIISSNGTVFAQNYNSSAVTSKNVIRPSFYLDSEVQFSKGTGTSSDPFRLVVW